MNHQTFKKATLGGGCFWCLEAVYEQLVGVAKVQSGYSGGHLQDPSYEQVCSEETGHAEVVQISFDPKSISYEQLLEIFYSIHDPTTLNRQGHDTGTQYRSAIFYHDEEQKSRANQKIAELEAALIWNSPIVTEVVQYSEFYPAEQYHSQYYQRNLLQPYCQSVISPKVSKFRKQFRKNIRSEFT